MGGGEGKSEQEVVAVCMRRDPTYVKASVKGQTLPVCLS